MNIESSYDPRRQILTEILINIDSGGVYRNSRFLLRFSVSSTVIMNSLVWTGMYSTRIVLYFSLIPHAISFPYLFSELRLIKYLSRSNAFKNNVPDNVPPDTWLLTTHFHTRNNSKWPKILTNSQNRWTDGLNRWVWPKIRLTDRLTEIWNSSLSIL